MVVGAADEEAGLLVVPRQAIAARLSDRGRVKGGPLSLSLSLTHSLAHTHTYTHTHTLSLSRFLALPGSLLIFGLSLPSQDPPLLFVALEAKVRRVRR